MKKNIKYLLMGLCLLTKVDAAYQSATLATGTMIPHDIPEARALGLAHLNQMNAWFAHERFWAAGGVIDPNTYDKQQELYAAFAGPPIAFLNDLSIKLSTEMGAVGAAPTPESIEDLVRRSQQILLTIAAGTPGAEGLVRLNPTNAADWQVIRKAMFLALSMTTDPEKGGRSFLSQLYDCGKFYPEKTAETATRSYYWKLEGLAKSFSKLWDGIKTGKTDAVINAGLQEVVNNFDPMSAIGGANPRYYRGSNYPMMKEAYEQAKAMISVGSARAELIAAQALHPRLNFQQAFVTLYPDLTAYTEYHVPNERAEMLMGAVRPVIAPIAFIPVRVCLNYTAGKWSLKGKNETSEHIIWSQGASASEEFIGSLEDDRGTHLFNFRVDGAVATIKAISTGYVINSVGVGATVVVANGEELGFVETSAYPTTVDNDTGPSNPASLHIDTDYYRGMKGVLVSRRDSTWVSSKQVNLWDGNGYETKRNSNGNEYKFFSQRGHGIFAYKDVVLESNDTHLSFSEVIAGQWAALMCSSSSDPSLLATHGAVVSAGDTLYINMGHWHTDTQTAFAGISDAMDKMGGEVSKDRLLLLGNNQVFNSNQALIHHGRMLACFTNHLHAYDPTERDKFTTGADVYGYFGDYLERKPTFTLYTLMPDLTPEYSSRDRHSNYVSSGVSDFLGVKSSGSGSRYSKGGTSSSSVGFAPSSVGQSAPSSFGSFFQPGGNLPGMGGHSSIAGMAASMIPAGITEQSVDIGMGSREGNVTSFASLSLASRTDSLSIGTSYTSGVSGRSVDLSSAYSGSGDHASILHDIHVLTSAGIMQLTDRYAGRLYMDGVTMEERMTSAMFDAILNPRSASKVKAVLKVVSLLKKVAELSEEPEVSATGEKSSSSAATGGDGEDPEEKKYKISDDNADATLPTGHRKPGEATPKFHTKNEPTKIGDTNYTGHALDEMRAQGLTPSVVEQAVQKGVSCPGRLAGTTVKYDPVNNVSVVVNSEGSVVTTSFGKLAGVL
ncbi:MAG: hypothetical protein WCJ92_07470 [Alphaproteobacteria bacterium]